MEDRTAIILADCIDELERGQRSLDEILDQYPEYRSEIEPLLGLVSRFQQAPDVKPSRQFRLNSRRSLTNSLSDHNATERFPGILVRIMNLKDTFVFQSNPIFARAIVIVLVLLFTSVITVQAARQATPGSAFYPVKTGLESLQLALANDEKDLALQLQFAQERNDAILRLEEEGRYEDIQLAQDDFNHYVTLASDTLAHLSTSADGQENVQLAEVLDETMKKNVSVLEAVLAKAPDQAKPAIENAIQNNLKDHGLANPKKDATSTSTLTSTQDSAVVSTPVVNGTPEVKPTKDTGNDAKPTKDPAETPVTVEEPVQTPTTEPKEKPTQKPTKEKEEKEQPTTDPSTSGNSPGNEPAKTPPGNENNNDSQNKDKPNKP